jgi:Ca2+-binding RTX toxin-like protein
MNLTAPAGLTDLTTGVYANSGTLSANLSAATGLTAVSFALNTGAGATSITAPALSFTFQEPTIGTGTVTITGGNAANTITVGGTPATAAHTFTSTAASKISYVAGAGVQTITTGAGADTITGGKGDDIIKLAESASAADTVVFIAHGDNGNDTITGFTVGSDLLQLKDLISSIGAETPIAAGALTTTTKVVYQLGGLAAGSADSTTAAAAAISAGATWTNANVTAYVVLSDDNSSSIYVWADASGAGAVAGELTLIGTVDAAMTTPQIATAVLVS